MTKSILFSDLFPVLREPTVFKDMLDILTEHIAASDPKVEAVVGLESRGFLIGPSLALNLKVPFIPVRKPGKLAGQVKSASYSLEYGTDSLEIQTESISQGLRCVIVDDLIATGGSLKATNTLIESCGGRVVENVVVMELVGLNGRANIPSTLFSLIQY